MQLYLPLSVLGLVFRHIHFDTITLAGVLHLLVSRNTCSHLQKKRASFASSRHTGGLEFSAAIWRSVLQLFSTAQGQGQGILTGASARPDMSLLLLPRYCCQLIRGKALYIQLEITQRLKRTCFALRTRTLRISSVVDVRITALITRLSSMHAISMYPPYSTRLRHITLALSANVRKH